LNILLVHPHIFAGGAEKAIVYLGQNLRRMGHEVSIVTLSTDCSKIPFACQNIDYVKPAAELPVSNDGTLSSTVSMAIREMNALHGLLRNIWKRFDVCVPGNFPAYWSTYNLSSHMPVVWLCSEVLGPYGVTKDSYDASPIFRSLFKAIVAIDKRIVAQGVHEIVTCSSFCGAMVKERYGRDSHVAYTGVNYDYFNQSMDQAEAKKKFGLDGSYVLLHVGFMVKRKNQILSMRAVERLLREMPDLKLVFVGGGPHETVLRKEVKRLRLDEHVIFMGSVDEETLKTLYYACDVNLYPTEDQTFGLVPFEAIVCGKVSVVSGCSGAARLLKDMDAAAIVIPTVEEIVAAVRRIRQGKLDVDGMVNRGKRFVGECLTWDAYSKVVAGILEKACVHSSTMHHK
jgi:glycosyltransferase involved in cell wall biosynthesis